ncbi:MAG TPA: CoA transferase [Dehalococcoidia bacterium]|jgi:formyl-CoA transferase|nr:CoA transferase [Dehalococcoidia bacterium]
MTGSIPQPAGPLQGVRVLDLSRVLAGPYCAMMLGDMGAEVIKIEQPGEGDETRAWGPPFAGGESAYYLAANRNKRGITLNLKHPEGRQILLDLVRRADVLIENFKLGTLERMDLADGTFWQVNPGLIHASITGFGTAGPYAEYGGYDFIIQAMSGIMSVTGEPAGEPMKVGIAIVDVTAGLFTLNGILAALYARRDTGRGQRIDVSLLESALAWLVNVGQNYLVSGEPARRYGNAHPNVVPYQVFYANDRPLALALANPRQFRTFCELAGRPELADDRRFRSNADRLANRAQLIPIVQSLVAQRSADEWLAILNANGVPAGPINTVAEAFADPQVHALGAVVALPHPTAGDVRVVGSPIHMSDTPVRPRSAPPLHGADTAAVLSELLHLPQERIAELRQAGAI